MKHGGTVICAAVSPYKATRNDVRNLFPEGQFCEVFVDTPLEVCEARDVKGLYAKARRGEIKGFTGIDDPYEAPEGAEVRLGTVVTHVRANAEVVIRWLEAQGLTFECGQLRTEDSMSNAELMTNESRDGQC